MDISTLEPVMKKYLDAIQVINDNTTTVKPLRDEMTSLKKSLIQSIHEKNPQDVAIFVDGTYIVKDRSPVQMKQITDIVLMHIFTSYTQGSFEDHFQEQVSHIDRAPRITVKTCRPRDVPVVHESISGCQEFLQSVDNIANVQKPIDHVKRAKCKILNIILEFLIVHRLDMVHLGSDYFLKDIRHTKTKPTMAQAAAIVWPTCQSDATKFPALWRAAMVGEVSEETVVVKHVKDKLPEKYAHLLTQS